jgi:hypothetical protein
MEAMRETWTDERLDDFRSHVDQRFAQVDQRFDQVDQRFDQVDQRFDRVDAEFRAQRLEMRTELSSFRKEMDTRLGAIQRLVIQIGAGTIGTLVLGIFTVLATR